MTGLPIVDLVGYGAEKLPIDVKRTRLVKVSMDDETVFCFDASNWRNSHQKPDDFLEKKREKQRIKICC